MPDRNTPRLYIQASQADFQFAAEIQANHGFGAILVAPSDSRRHQREEKLITAGEQYAKLTGFMPDLDANYYSGSNRRTGESAISLDWVRLQQKSGVPIPQTDPGFVEAERRDQLSSVLNQSVRIEQQMGVPIRSVLALDYTWITKHPSEVADAIDTSGLREVSLLLGHPTDPFGVQLTAQGMLKILPQGRVAVHRTDLSALPCLAAGAMSAAIGTGSGLRHIFTASRSGRGGYFPTGSPSIIIPGTLSWRLQDRLNDYLARFPDDHFWNCQCDNCYGRPIGIAVRTVEAVTGHNYNLISDYLNQVLNSPDPMRTWYSMCQLAQFRIDEIASVTQLPWDAPGFLGAWLSTQTSKVGV